MGMYMVTVNGYSIPVTFANIRGAKLYGKWGTFEVKCNPSIPRESIILFIESRREWMEQHLQEHENSINKFKEQIKQHNYTLQRYDKSQLKHLIRLAVRKYQSRRGCVGNITINTTMRKNWATCSAKNNLTFNHRMCYLPPHLIDYIVYHEMCHLTVKSHNAEFYKLIMEEYPSYEDYDLELASYNYMITLRLHEEKVKQCKEYGLKEIMMEGIV